MASSHCVLAVRSNAKLFATPRSEQRFHKLADRIKYDLRCMPVEHWDGDEVQVDQDAAVAESQAHVKERLAAMRADITRAKMPRRKRLPLNPQFVASLTRKGRE